MFVKKLRNRDIFIFPEQQLDTDAVYEVINSYVDFNNLNLNDKAQKVLLFSNFIQFAVLNIDKIKEKTYQSILKKADIVIKSDSFNYIKKKNRNMIIKSYFLLRKNTKNLSDI